MKQYLAQLFYKTGQTTLTVCEIFSA